MLPLNRAESFFFSLFTEKKTTDSRLIFHQRTSEPASQDMGKPIQTK